MTKMMLSYSTWNSHDDADNYDDDDNDDNNDADDETVAAKHSSISSE